MDTIENFISITRGIVQHDGLRDYRPTAIFPERQHVAVLDGCPVELVGSELERAVLTWANQLAVGSEVFIVAFVHSEATLKFVRRGENGYEHQTIDVRNWLS